MAVIGTTLPPRTTSTSAPKNPTSKVSLEDDTYDVKVISLGFFHEDERDKDTGAIVRSDKSILNFVRVKVETADGFILSKKMKNSTYKNANFAKFLAAATGIPVTDEAALNAVDTDTLTNAPLRVLTSTKADDEYTNIAQWLAPRKAAAAA